MLELAHRRHGKLPWSRLFDPAITLADQGFAVSPRLHAQIAGNRALFAQQAARDYFYPNGQPAAIGHVLKNSAYAAVLKRIATGGVNAFYEGEIAAEMGMALPDYQELLGKVRGTQLVCLEDMSGDDGDDDYLDRHVASDEHNPLALLRKELTEEEVMAAAVMWPGVMTRLMACPPTCGSAAAIVCSEAFAKKHGLSTDVRIRAQAMTTDGPATFEARDMREVVGFSMAKNCAEQVYAEAGLGPGQRGGAADHQEPGQAPHLGASQGPKRDLRPDAGRIAEGEEETGRSRQRHAGISRI
jgi:hypothetical protein